MEGPRQVQLLPHPVAVSPDVHDVAVVDEPVHQGRRRNLVGDASPGRPTSRGPRPSFVANWPGRSWPALIRSLSVRSAGATPRRQGFRQRGDGLPPRRGERRGARREGLAGNATVPRPVPCEATPEPGAPRLGDRSRPVARRTKTHGAPDRARGCVAPDFNSAGGCAPTAGPASLSSRPRGTGMTGQESQVSE